MASKSISIDDLPDELQDILEEYNREIVKGIKAESKKSMAKLVKKTKETAPVSKDSDRRGQYKNSITSKKLSENSKGASYLWYVKGDDYRLSHLLEDGHALRQGGRVEGTHFIKNASEPITEEYIKNVEKVIGNG